MSYSNKFFFKRACSIKGAGVLKKGTAALQYHEAS